MAKASSKGKHHGDLAVTATVEADGVTWAVTGCCVEDVRAALDELRATPQTAELPAPAGSEG
jgi:hypothetical protein